MPDAQEPDPEGLRGDVGVSGAVAPGVDVGGEGGHFGGVERRSRACACCEVVMSLWMLLLDEKDGCAEDGYKGKRRLREGGRTKKVI